jgi:hypothetical protein
METKTCKYRNCNKELTGRKDKIYCDRKCKACEKIYIKRGKQFIEKSIKQNQDIIDMIKYIKTL